MLGQPQPLPAPQPGPMPGPLPGPNPNGPSYKGRTVKIGVALAAAIVLLAGCPGDAQKSAPEVDPANMTDGTNTSVIRMPEGFRNVSFTCHGSVGVYVTSRGFWQNGNADATPLPSGIAVLANDPNCKTQ